MSIADTPDGKAALAVLAQALRKAHPDIAAELVRREDGEQPPLRFVREFRADPKPAEFVTGLKRKGGYLTTFDDPDDMRHMPIAVEVIGERIRQRKVKGWSIEHDDDQHEDGHLARAAAAYALAASYDGHARDNQKPNGKILSEWWQGRHTPIRELWPWDWRFWKPKNRRSDLIKAAALIFAEIERLDRATERAARPMPPRP